MRRQGGWEVVCRRMAWHGLETRVPGPAVRSHFTQPSRFSAHNAGLDVGEPMSSVVLCDFLRSRCAKARSGINWRGFGLMFQTSTVAEFKMTDPRFGPRQSLGRTLSTATRGQGKLDWPRAPTSASLASRIRFGTREGTGTLFERDNCMHGVLV